jgi:hypothetical protein
MKYHVSLHLTLYLDKYKIRFKYYILILNTKFQVSRHNYDSTTHNFLKIPPCRNN